MSPLAQVEAQGGPSVALRDGIIPPTLGTTQVDQTLPDCTITTCVQQSHQQVILSLAASFGGRYSAIALRRHERLVDLRCAERRRNDAISKGE